ncbi:hypothetical protein WN51_03409 [Melipona quadrifasciata]|uniref:Uncharacterized protein n=1 Tax=Melipona quadrifasciata TaxID=166423 RepID=A0A0N0BEI1_9HYME|nr:hypothetical protein WN51_03409 [Melipona quadrifasciata]
MVQFLQKRYHCEVISLWVTFKNPTQQDVTYPLTNYIKRYLKSPIGSHSLPPPTSTAHNSQGRRIPLTLKITHEFNQQ